jgi:hypothetical protein
MSHIANEHEIREVSRLHAKDRYAYFIKKVADWEESWGLRGIGGFVTSADDDGASHLPLWPNGKFAQVCAQGNWSDATPECISLQELLEEGIPRLHKEAGMLAIFPLADGKAVSVDPLRVAEDLRQECSLMEDE